MQKKVYFLTGFPRSGNTLISTLLNQNPDIAATGHSILPEIFFQIDRIKNQDSIYINFKLEDNVKRIEQNIFNNYFQGWNQKYIIDRGEWATPYNYHRLEKYCPNKIKIIFLLRNPIDVIKSYLHLCNKYPDFYINKQYNFLDKTSLHKTEIEEKIELITKKGDLFDTICMSYNFIKSKNNVLFIRYEDLVEKPNKIMKNIYSFLDIPQFKHSFNIKSQFSVNGVKYNDNIIGAPIHTLHTGKLKNFNYPNIELPKYIIEKYKGALYNY
jgi:hypothetical protein